MITNCEVTASAQLFVEGQKGRRAAGSGGHTAFGALIGCWRAKPGQLGGWRRNSAALQGFADPQTSQDDLEPQAYLLSRPLSIHKQVRARKKKQKNRAQIKHETPYI